MSRLKDLRKHVDAELDRMPDPEKRISAAAHLYGVSLAAAMLAKKRGLDPELASMAGMLHDLHAYRAGSYDDHAHKGAELARQILEELKLTGYPAPDVLRYRFVFREVMEKTAERAQTVYKAAEGETLWDVSYRFDVVIDRLVALNPWVKRPDEPLGGREVALC